MTFMVHVRLGQMGVARSSVANAEQPGMVDSSYEFYIARQGQPFQLAHRQDRPRGPARPALECGHRRESGQRQ